MNVDLGFLSLQQLNALPQKFLRELTMGKLKLVQKRENRKYYYTNFRHPLTGKIVGISTKTSNLKEAQQFAAEHLIQLKGSKLAPEVFGDYKLSDAIQRFIEIKGYTKTEHRLIYLNKQLGKYRLCDISYDLVFSEVLRPKIKSGCKYSSINQYLRFLKAVLTKAKKWGWINELPELESLEEVTQIRTRVLDMETEYPRLISKLPKYLINPVNFTLLTGLRKSELVNLTWNQISPDFTELTFTGNQKNRDTSTTTLPHSASAILKSVYGDNEYFVFSNPETKNGSLGDFKKSWSTARKNAGIKDLTFHDLRRTYATYIYKTDSDLKAAISKSLRHKSERSIKSYIPEENKQQQVIVNTVVNDAIASYMTH